MKYVCACHPVEMELQQTNATCRLLVTGVARWLGTLFVAFWFIVSMRVFNAFLRDIMSKGAKYAQA